MCSIQAIQGFQLSRSACIPATNAPSRRWQRPSRTSRVGDNAPMQWLWLSIAIVATVGYHVVLKVTPAGVNPFLSLAITYAGVTAIFVFVYLLTPAAVPLRTALPQVNWTALALAVAIAGLDVGFLLLYRSGFDVSLGQIVTQSAAALALLLLGVALFSEKISLVNAGGILLCVVGLWMMFRR